MNNKTKAIISALLAFASANLVAAEKIMYKWTDSNGEVHYTERAPKGIEYTRIKTKVDSSAAISTRTTPKTEEEQKSPAASKAYTTWRKENCTAANENLDILRNASRIGVDDGQGGKRLMTDEEKAKQIKDMEAQRDKYCQASAED
jgi:hypothetical protein